VHRSDQHERADVDAVLATRAAQILTTTSRSGKLASDGSFAVRLINGDQVSAQAGPSTGAPAAAREGYSTVAGTNGLWRSLSEPLKSGVQMQVLISLRAAQEQHSGNTRTVLLLVLLAALLSGLGTWYVTGLAMRPLQRMRDAVRDLRPDDPEQRLPEVRTPPEAAELTAAFNGLLDRLHDAEPWAAHPVVIENTPAPEPPAPEPPAPVVEPEPLVGEVVAASGLSADEERELRISLATLGDGLETLLSDPDLPVQRHLMLAGLADEHRRLVLLLESMRTGADDRR
jgi:HAMP domain-containing protein